jgi:hypothetical protein
MTSRVVSRRLTFPFLCEGRSCTVHGFVIEGASFLAKREGEWVRLSLRANDGFLACCYRTPIITKAGNGALARRLYLIEFTWADQA